MAHPKRRQSSTRRDKRRTFYKATPPCLSKCSTTSQWHIYHRAYWYQDKLYYRGKILLEKNNSKVIDVN